MIAGRPGEVGATQRVFALLVVLGFALEAVYVVTMLKPFYLPTFYATPLLDLGKLTSYGHAAGWIFVATTAVLFALYYSAFRLVAAADTAIARRVLLVIIAFGALFSLTLALVYPYGAADVFDYMAYGRIMARYGENPFLHPPSDFAADVFLPYVAWKDLPFTYGPVWAAFSAKLSWLGGDSLLASLLLYKGFAIGAYLGTLLLVKSILTRLAPQHTPAGVILFAWNPLVVTETAANGHNDVVMMFFVLLAIRFLLNERLHRQGLSFVALAASVLTKFVTGMLFPLLLASLLRQPRSLTRRVALIAGGALGGIVLATLSYAPFWAGQATLAIQRRDELFTASLPAVVKLSLENFGGVADARFVGQAVFAAFGLYCLIEAWRLPHGVTPFVEASYRLVLVYLLFACLWFQPWYLIWLLALAAIRPALDSAHQSMLFSFTATMNYFVFDYLWIWNAQRLSFLDVQIIAVATIYAVPMAYSLWLILRSRRRTERGVAIPAD